MSSRSAIDKLKAILVIDLIIVAVAAGVYLYFQDQGLIVGAPKPAEFTLTDLTINPAEAQVFEPILIKVNVTNIGEEQGSYMANLTINNVLEENQTILLQGGNSTMVEFTVIKQVEGTYTVEIDGLSSSFNVKAPSPTSSAARRCGTQQRGLSSQDPVIGSANADCDSILGCAACLGACRRSGP